jgi:hypothetical protein
MVLAGLDRQDAVENRDRVTPLAMIPDVASSANHTTVCHRERPAERSIPVTVTVAAAAYCFVVSAPGDEHAYGWL